jgi:hypothetical protein
MIAKIIKFNLQTIIQKKKRLNIILYDFLFALFGVGIITVGRWHSIVYPIPFNPDEVQMAANALRIQHFGWNWDAIDGTTSGPLNSLILLWPTLFGGDVTLSLSRITATFLLSSVFILLYLSLKNITDYKFASIASFSLALFYSATRHPDFIHYSSELLPLAIIFTGNYLIVKIFILSQTANRSYFIDILIGICIGSIFFAKLQAIPIAIIMFLFNIYSIHKTSREQKALHITIFTGVTALPFLIFLLPLYLNGNFADFYTSYIINALLYIHKITSGYSLYHLVANDPVFIFVFYFWLSIIVLGLINLAFINRNKESYVFIIYSFSILLASIYSVARPGREFSHYLMLSMPFFVFFAGSFFSFTQNNEINKLFFFYTYFLFFIVLVAALFINISNRGGLSSHFFRYKTILPFKVEWRNPRIFSWLDLENNCGLVWGWMPQWYLYGGLVPAGRETHNQTQIRKNILTAYYRYRLVNDIEKSPPDIIIDAVNGHSFGFNNNKKNGINSFPSLLNFVKSKYELVPDDGFYRKECPEIYVSHSTINNYNNKIIKIKAITGITSNIKNDSINSLNNLNDCSVTEDSCIDYWLLPDNQLGSFKVIYTQNYFVKKIMILNTNNGENLDRATSSIAFSLIKNGKVVFYGYKKLKPYPYWTTIEISPFLSDSIIIDILGFKGIGAGLNEIKIFHSENNHSKFKRLLNHRVFERPSFMPDVACNYRDSQAYGMGYLRHKQLKSKIRKYVVSKPDTDYPSL